MKKKMPVMLTFDVDGESLWASRELDHLPVTRSLGTYGILEGLPRIMKTLEKNDVPATFFVPGIIAERYPEQIMSIDRAGHEICNHSYSHTYPDKLPSAAAEKEELTKTNEILERLTGKRPRGYRSPAWEFSENTLGILLDIGFDYSSNMMHTDRIGYLQVFDRKTDIVELPIHWVLDDAAFWLYTVRIPGKAIQPVSAVQEFWIAEFDALYEEFMEEDDSDLCFILTCHPQVIGRPARMKVLDNLIKHIKTFENIEFTTCWQTAQKYKK